MLNNQIFKYFYLWTLSFSLATGNLMYKELSKQHWEMTQYPSLLREICFSLTVKVWEKKTNSNQSFMNSHQSPIPLGDLHVNVICSVVPWHFVLKPTNAANVTPPAAASFLHFWSSGIYTLTALFNHTRKIGDGPKSFCHSRVHSPPRFKIF